MSLDEKTDWNELVGKRVLIEDAHASSFFECRILEVTQSKKFVKLLHEPGAQSWRKIVKFGGDKFVEVLKNDEEIEEDEKVEKERQKRISRLCRKSNIDTFRNELQKLCYAYDIKNGVCPEHTYDGLALYQYFLETNDIKDEIDLIIYYDSL